MVEGTATLEERRKAKELRNSRKSETDDEKERKKQGIKIMEKKNESKRNERKKKDEKRELRIFYCFPTK